MVDNGGGILSKALINADFPTLAEPCHGVLTKTKISIATMANDITHTVQRSISGRTYTMRMMKYRRNQT
jgi:hypothetical protein